ncbi:hypothetical protein KUH03_30780 [Sphingobacterium sp. E70]|uniref:hypothetical protein n=1 Tax=Sphingobacterium sp. E70 TaxID=2853439 RepID=UPI00211CBC6F|nr:hypothetical protein [Sphingobacterium sp. E70]ULT23522.1 hypothetical protein KUH03_30780 [Sphingobacterium sp. E70]
MIQQIKPSIRSKAISQISRATFGLLVGACCLLASYDTLAQTTSPSASLQQNRTPLKSFQGYYQLPNKVAFIAFDEQDNKLHATQLWDQKKSYQLVRKDDTHFESKNEGYAIEFLKIALEILTKPRSWAELYVSVYLLTPIKLQV